MCTIIDRDVSYKTEWLRKKLAVKLRRCKNYNKLFQRFIRHRDIGNNKIISWLAKVLRHTRSAQCTKRLHILGNSVSTAKTVQIFTSSSISESQWASAELFSQSLYYRLGINPSLHCNSTSRWYFAYVLYYKLLILLCHPRWNVFGTHKNN